MSDWPQLDEYSISIQNPSSNLSDSELQRLKPRLNKMGLPLVYAGASACVYEMASHSKRVAVRVFKHPVSNQRDRYRLIAEHLSAVLPTYMTSFEYHEKGIKVGSNWFPLLKMDWVSGKPLLNWIQDVAIEPSRLLRLAAKWRAMIGSLHGLGVAHGDIQQGNVLVSEQDSLTLVDYDCIYVPTMAGETSPERGHPNWNHPARSSSVFNASLDQFPGLVGYLSIVAVAHDHSLLDRYCNGENIILSRGDLENPDSSSVLSELLGSNNQAVRSLSSTLTEWCQSRIDYSTLEEACGGVRIPKSAQQGSNASTLSSSTKLGAAPIRQSRPHGSTTRAQVPTWTAARPSATSKTHQRKARPSQSTTKLPASGTTQSVPRSSQKSARSRRVLVVLLLIPIAVALAYYSGFGFRDNSPKPGDTPPHNDNVNPQARDQGHSSDSDRDNPRKNTRQKDFSFRSGGADRASLHNVTFDMFPQTRTSYRSFAIIDSMGEVFVIQDSANTTLRLPAGKYGFAFQSRDGEWFERRRSGFTVGK